MTTIQDIVDYYCIEHRTEMNDFSGLTDALSAPPWTIRTTWKSPSITPPSSGRPSIQ